MGAGCGGAFNCTVEVLALGKAAGGVFVLIQTGPLAVKAESGGGFTVTTMEVTGEAQLVGAGPVTCKVTVLVPVFAQLTVCAPAPVKAPWAQPSQFQANVEFGITGVPVWVKVTGEPAQVRFGFAVKALPGV